LKTGINMGEHYFTRDPGAEHEEKEILFSCRGKKCVCVTDSGVFSRDGLDEGTRLLLESLPKLSGRVLDLGCGWGPVGLILGRCFPDIEIVMTDINERAVDLANRNLRKNDVTNAYAVQGDITENVAGPFDAVILNPPIRTGKENVYKMYDESHACLKDGGALYIVIRKQQGAESTAKHLKTVFLEVERIERDKGYWVLRCMK